MTVRYHEIPEELFGALAAGGGGPAGVRALAVAEHSKHAILLRGVLAAAQGAGAAQARFASYGWEVLAEAERRDRDAAASVLRYPAVGAWALRTLQALDTGAGAPGAVPARLASVAAAAAVRSGLDTEVPVLPVDGIVSLPSLGAVRVDADKAVVRSSVGRAEVRWAGGRVEIPSGTRRDGSGWLGIWSCQAGNVRVMIDDLDPFRIPAVTRLAPRLTEPEARGWERILAEGWSVLATWHPAVAAEAAEAISAIVPLSRSAHGQLSSSSPEAFGAVAMSEPADPATCAVTLTHEVQHLKLCAVLDIVRLTLRDDGRRYYAPWRNDPRPIAGLLQGAYAYLGVTEFWRRQRELAAGAAQLKAESEFSLWRSGTARVMDTLLSSGRLTWAGTTFVQRMAETASVWVGEPVPATAQAMALRESRKHLDRWEQDNGPVPS